VGEVITQGSVIGDSIRIHALPFGTKNVAARNVGFCRYRMVVDPQSYVNQQSMLIPVVVAVVAMNSNRSSDCGSRICDVGSRRGRSGTYCIVDNAGTRQLSMFK
jgi:hypothetical protein